MRLLISACIVAFGMSSAAHALPPINGYLKQAMGDKPEYQAYAATLAAAKDKCASCHKPGVDKAKVKGHGLNDFGEVMHKNLDDKAFMAAHKAKDNAEALRLFTEAWSKSIEAKNAEGEVYGELIKAGKLPGRNEEAAK